jgi:hypothetical protein
MMQVRKAGTRIAMLAVIALLAAGCTPTLFPPAGADGETATCPTGVWKIDTETITGQLSTVIPGLTVTGSGPGVTLTLTDGTWALHADQTLNASLTTSFGNASGTVHVTGDANGALTTTPSNLTFTLASLSGSASYDATILGLHVNGSTSLPGSGLEQLYGLTGTAGYSCASGGLSLTFASYSMHAHH